MKDYYYLQIVVFLIFAGRLLLCDPRLAIGFFFNPVIPSHYRLVGPHTWSGARDAIITTWHRINYPHHKNIKSYESTTFYLICLVAIAFLAYLCMFI